MIKYQANYKLLSDKTYSKQFNFLQIMIQKILKSAIQIKCFFKKNSKILLIIANNSKLRPNKEDKKSYKKEII